MRRLLPACVVLLVMVAACGGKPPETPKPASSAEKPSSSEPSSTLGSEPSATAEPEPSNAKPEPRTVKYIMTTGGLEVEVEGVRFTPKAVAIKSGSGWGVRVTVSAKVLDEAAHSLLDPNNGPLAFAGSVDRGGQVLRIGDKRVGNGEKLIGPGDKLEVSREWPSKTEKPLEAGQTLTLEVGLWGIGPDADQRRAVRDFFQVKMRAEKAKPVPVITPPPSANP